MPRRTKIQEKIISILVENPIITRGELYKRLGVSYQAMQKHLHALQESGIVKQSFVVDEDKIKINKYQFSEINL